MLEPEIVPLCLYGDENNSCIKLPVLDKSGYLCDTSVDLPFITKIYGVNPDFSPRPTSTDLLCIKNENNRTVTILSVYDPFNAEESQQGRPRVKIILWLDPTPYTVPLYVFKKNGSLVFSFVAPEPNSPYYATYKPSTLFVLMDPRDVVRLGLKMVGSTPGKDFNTENGIPKFLFSGAKNRCVPNPNGMPLGQCVALYNKHILDKNKLDKNPNLYQYLLDTYGEKKGRSLNYVFGIIIVIIFLFFVFYMIK